MDPTQTLTDILTGLYALKSPITTMKGHAQRMNDRAVLSDELRNLADWVERGAFPPDVDEALRGVRRDCCRYHRSGGIAWGSCGNRSAS